jgi:manganese/iron transport system substrate-binding protein
MKRLYKFQIVASILLFWLAGCLSPPTQKPASTQPLRVLATTTIVGDVVSQVGGGLIKLSILLPYGVDPHSFEPSPRDMALAADADVIFANGVSLEEFLEPLLESAGALDKVIYLSNGIDLKQNTTLPAANVAEEHDPLEGEGHADEHGHTGADPHTWTDPNNVIIWVDNIVRALSEQDAQNAATYQANAQAYQQQLQELDLWIKQQVEQIPVEKRVIVTDHNLFAYFAGRYGFTQVKAIIPGYSTLAEPSAQELAALENSIRELGIKAIFVGNTVNPALARRVAEDTGVQLIYIYTGSLSEPGEAAANYLDYIRYNVSAISNALK